MERKNVLTYKGYYTKIEYSVEDSLLWGKIEGINDLVLFESEDPKKIEQEFIHAVDEYLSFCAANDQNPNKPYKGTFNVRISPDLHKELSLYAFINDMSLNSAVEEAIEKMLFDKKKI